MLVEAFTQGVTRRELAERFGISASSGESFVHFVRFGVVEVVVGVGVFAVEQPAAADSVEQVLEQVGRRACWIEERDLGLEAVERIFLTRPADLFGDSLGLVDQFGQRTGGGNASLRRGHGGPDQVDHDFARRFACVEPFQHQGGRVDGECFNVICFDDDLGWVAVREFGGDVGRCLEPMCRSDRRGGRVNVLEQLVGAEWILPKQIIGGVHQQRRRISAGQEHRLSRPSGKITTFRLLDRSELVRNVRGYLVSQRGITEVVERAADSVSGLLDAHVGLKQAPAMRQIGFRGASMTVPNASRSPCLRQPSEFDSRLFAALAGWV